jgi:hypothetical protein
MEELKEFIRTDAVRSLQKVALESLADSGPFSSRRSSSGKENP